MYMYPDIRLHVSGFHLLLTHGHSRLSHLFPDTFFRLRLVAVLHDTKQVLINSQQLYQHCSELNSITMESPSPDHTFIAALSGASSSGKSTLARLLRSIFNIALPDRTLKLFILHEDDFYKPDDQIPVCFASLYIFSRVLLPISVDQDFYFSKAWRA